MDLSLNQLTQTPMSVPFVFHTPIASTSMCPPRSSPPPSFPHHHLLSHAAMFLWPTLFTMLRTRVSLHKHLLSSSTSQTSSNFGTGARTCQSPPSFSSTSNIHRSSSFLPRSNQTAYSSDVAAATEALLKNLPHPPQSSTRMSNHLRNSTQIFSSLADKLLSTLSTAPVATNGCTLSHQNPKLTLDVLFADSSSTSTPAPGHTKLEISSSRTTSGVRISMLK